MKRNWTSCKASSELKYNHLTAASQGSSPSPLGAATAELKLSSPELWATLPSMAFLILHRRCYADTRLTKYGLLQETCMAHIPRGPAMPPLQHYQHSWQLRLNFTLVPQHPLSGLRVSLQPGRHADTPACRNSQVPGHCTRSCCAWLVRTRCFCTSIRREAARPEIKPTLIFLHFITG